MRPFKTLAEYGCGGILQPGEKLRIKLHVAHGRGSIEKDVFLRSQPVVGKQFIPHMLSEGFQKFGNAAHGLRRVIEARHDGRARQYDAAVIQSGKPREVFKNAFVGLRRLCPVRIGIHVLDIEKHIGKQGRGFFQRFPGDESAGFHRGAQAAARPRPGGLKKRKKGD